MRKANESLELEASVQRFAADMNRFQTVGAASEGPCQVLRNQRKALAAFEDPWEVLIHRSLQQTLASFEDQLGAEHLHKLQVLSRTQKDQVQVGQMRIHAQAVANEGLWEARLMQSHSHIQVVGLEDAGGAAADRLRAADRLEAPQS